MSRLERDQLIALVKRIRTCSACEMDLDTLLTMLETNVPHPDATALIFHPPEGRDLTDEEVVDAALAYKASK